MLPKCAQMLPKCAQMLPKYAQKLPKYVQMLLKCVQNFAKMYPKVAKMCPTYAQTILVTFWKELPNFRQVFQNVTKTGHKFGYILVMTIQFWAPFVHILATYGHILDTFFVWTGFSCILVRFGHIFVTFQENMTKMCPYTHSQVVPRYDGYIRLDK